MITQNTKKKLIIDRLLENNDITPEEAAELGQSDEIFVPIVPVDAPEPFQPFDIEPYPFDPRQNWINDELNRRADHARRCACNPANGGSGLCGCTLASPVIYC